MEMIRAEPATAKNGLASRQTGKKAAGSNANQLHPERHIRIA